MSRHLLSVLVGFVLALASVPAGCGGGGPQCVIDTDCPLGERCASDQTCQRVRRNVDAGVADTDAGSGDTDAGSGGVDGGGGMDGGGDAASDAASSCRDVSGNWAMDSATPECMFRAFGQISVARMPELSPCTFRLTPTGSGPSGDLVLDADGRFRAMLTIGTGTAECSGMFDEAAATIACGACVMSFVRR
jgi:hypothetical protein